MNHSSSSILSALVIVAIPVFAAACSSSGSNPLCCNEFSVGGTVDANIGGSAQSKIAVQAIADIGGVASAAVADVTAACQGIASDLGADAAAQTDADSKTDSNERMNAWCALATAQIDATLMASAGATLKVDVTPAQCSASLTATADCQGSCDASAKCDIKATPPKCDGGTLTIDCKGGCTAMGGASVSCTGKCMASCTGSCTGSASATVDCDGKCDGTCAAGGSANGTGIQADGTCQGTCSGKCTLKADAKVSCSGTCDGKCEGTCQGSATASVKCDGTCDADYKPLSCTGGKLSGGCQVDAKCQASCNASASAKASCTPPAIKVSFSGAASLEGLAKLQSTLEANLPKIFEIKTKLELVADGVGTVSGNVSALTDIKAACIPAVAAAGVQAAKDVTGAVQASATVTAKVGG